MIRMVDLEEGNLFWQKYRKPNQRPFPNNSISFWQGDIRREVQSQAQRIKILQEKFTATQDRLDMLKRNNVKAQQQQGEEGEGEGNIVDDIVEEEWTMKKGQLMSVIKLWKLLYFWKGLAYLVYRELGMSRYDDLSTN